MSLPEHAYFVQGQCSNEINAACGIRCQTGYQLRGTSLRLCTEDAVWTGTDVTCHGLSFLSVLQCITVHNYRVGPKKTGKFLYANNFIKCYRNTFYGTRYSVALPYYSCCVSALYPVLTIKQTSSNHRVNIQQMHSKYTCMACALIPRCLLDVCLMFASCRLCSMHASCLLNVCSIFA